MKLHDNDNLLSADHTDNTDDRHFLSQVSKDLRNNFNHTCQTKSKFRKVRIQLPMHLAKRKNKNKYFH